MTDDFATRSELLRRMQNRDDQDAWREFAKLYVPMLHGWAKSRGLNTTDAEEVVSQMLLGLVRCFPKFTYDRTNAKFRTYLSRTMTNCIIDLKANAKLMTGEFSESVSEFLANLPDGSELRDELDRACRLEELDLFEKAVELARCHSGEDNFNAWELTKVKNLDGLVAAEQLGISVAALYQRSHRFEQRIEIEGRKLSLDNE